MPMFGIRSRRMRGENSQIISTTSSALSRVEEASRVNNDVSFLSRSLIAPRPRKVVAPTPVPISPRIGDKRKRCDTMDAITQYSRDTTATKRPLIPTLQLTSQPRPQTQSSSSGSLASPIGLFSEGSNSSTEPATSDQGTSQPTQTMEPAPTPSLCSDNDPEKDDEHDQPPSTPPLVVPSRNMYRFRGAGIPVTPSERSHSRILNRSLLLKPQEVEREQGEEHNEEEEHIQAPEKEEAHDAQDHDEHPADYEDSFVPIHPVTPEDPADHESQPTIFKKRLPVSPLPNKSPRKPYPPSRRRSTPHPKKLSLPPLDRDHDGDEDRPPALSFFSPPVAISTPGPNIAHNLNLEKAVVDTPDIFTQPPKTKPLPRNLTSQPSRIPVHSTRLRHKSSIELKAQSQSWLQSQSSYSSRHMTLGEELWIAQQSDEVNGDELDEDLYVGMGTRSKKEGFLAHGGAGGVPVFMGVGYMEGAEERQKTPIDRQNTPDHD